MTRRIAVLALPLLLLGGVAAWATSGETPDYSLTDLGNGVGVAINDSGLVAGYATGTDGTWHAVVWNSATGHMTDLGIADSFATGIDENGVVVGSAVTGGVQLAFRWQNGVRTDLGTLPGDTQSQATGINASGQITGWSSGGASGTRAFVWTNGTMSDLGSLGGSVTVPSAINDAGEVVGGSTPTGDPVIHDFPVRHAFLWDATAGIGDLDDGTGDLGSSAYGINESGDAVGAAWFWSAGYYDATAALWRDGTTTLLSGVGNSFATAVNDATDAHGVQVVGRALHDYLGPYPTLWEIDDAGGVTQTNLDELVDTSDLPQGLGYPAAINASGQIVINGELDGNVRVLTPGGQSPPPAPAPAVPGAPASLVAQSGTERVTLSWSAVPTALTYAVKRASSSGGPFTTVAAGLTTSGYADTTAPLGSTSYYVVTASNLAGEGAPSPVASAARLPLPPTNLTASAGNGKHKDRIDLRWTASASANVAGYKVYLRASTGDSLVATLAPTTSYAVTGLARRTTYSYVVTAVHAGGQESAASNVASATTR